MFGYDHPKLCDYGAALMDAPCAEDEALALLEALAGRIAPRDPAFIVYTSGTTGNPKGALVAHGRHLAAAHNLVEHYPLLAEPQRTVVYLPLCHVLAATGDHLAARRRRGAALRRRSGGARGDAVRGRADRALHRAAIPAEICVAGARRGRQFERREAHGIRLGDACRPALRARALEGRASARRARLRRGPRGAFRPILNKLGSTSPPVISGGAPLPAETMALWQMWGVNVCEIYGQTEEAGAIITGQRGPFPRPGDVGTVAPGFELALAGSGEILIRGEHVFERYWGNAEATREVLGEDGWLRTGDVGEWVAEGPRRLRLVDRARDFIVTSGGKTLSPSYVENIVRSSPYIAEVAVFGHARNT
jgi:long-chain acyl-CoA synthetase